MSCEPPSLTYIGHATVVVDLDGARVVTDPLLRNRTVHLHRYAPAPDFARVAGPDAVLLSHLHLDHTDFPSLRRLGEDARLIVPRGAGRLARRRGFRSVEEVAPGETARVGSLTVTATPANHSGFRPPVGPVALAVGYRISGSRRIYFAGDTDLFPEMADLGGGLDVAVLPIWGWGRALGPGHLNPQTAAEALRLLRPSLAIPIHWGTLAPIGVRPPDPGFLNDPPHLFARHAARLAPDVEVRIVPPGECTSLVL
ncbi:MAG: MBL fold metallo-hydrolase [Chloroflexi bacterium]|nr:MBL fold metallo-hydrolase [Chloroflexota bacterium]